MANSRPTSSCRPVPKAEAGPEGPVAWECQSVGVVRPCSGNNGVRVVPVCRANEMVGEGRGPLPVRRLLPTANDPRRVMANRNAVPKVAGCAVSRVGAAQKAWPVRRLPSTANDLRLAMANRKGAQAFLECGASPVVGVGQMPQVVRRLASTASDLRLLRVRETVPSILVSGVVPQ
jgi:hypothetical protein